MEVSVDSDATNISITGEGVEFTPDSVGESDKPNTSSSVEQLQPTDWSDFGFGGQCNKPQARKKAARVDSDEDDWWFRTNL